MKIQCNQCGAQGSIDAAKIPSQGAKISCPRCKNIFWVKKEEPLPVPSVGSAKNPMPSGTAVQEASPIPPESGGAPAPPSKDTILVPPETTAQEADRAARQGIEFLRKKMFKEALESFQRVVELNPRHPEGYRNLGVIYGQQKMWSEALKALEKALEVNPKDLQSQKNLGILYLQQKNFESAFSTLEKVLTLNPKDTKVRTYLDLALKGKKSQAKIAQEPAPPQESMPGTPSPGDLSRGTPENLLGEKQQVPERVPEDVLGRVREEPKEEVPEPASQKPAEPALLEGPSKPEPVKTRVSCLLDEACDLLDSQRPKDAIAKCKEALEIEPYNPSIYFMMGLIYEERQMWDQATQAYEKTLELDPDYEGAQRNLSLVKKQRKKPIWKIWGRK